MSTIVEQPWYEQRIETHPRGRVCCHPFCKTILSVYNPDPYCAQHAPEPDLTYLGIEHIRCAVCGDVVSLHKRKTRELCRDCYAKSQTSKECPRCGRLLKLAEFGIDRRTPTGRQSYCKQCDNERRREKHRRKAKKLDAVQRAQSEVRARRALVQFPNHLRRLELAE